MEAAGQAQRGPGSDAVLIAAVLVLGVLVVGLDRPRRVSTTAGFTPVLARPG